MSAFDIAGAAMALMLCSSLGFGMLNACSREGPAPDWVGPAFWTFLASLGWAAFCIARLFGASL